MPTPFEQYETLHARLITVREANEGENSPEEDEILEAMTDIWYTMSPEEREQAEVLPPAGPIKGE